MYISILTIFTCLYLPTCAKVLRTTDRTIRKRISEALPPLLMLTSLDGGESRCHGRSCGDNSRCYDLKSPICRCNQGYIFSTIRKACTNKRILIIKGCIVNEKWIEAYNNTNTMEFIKFARAKESSIMNFIELLRMPINGVKINIAKRHKKKLVIDIAFIFNESRSEDEAREEIEANFRYGEIKQTPSFQQLHLSLKVNLKKEDDLDGMNSRHSLASDETTEKIENDDIEEEESNRLNSTFSLTNSNKTGDDKDFPPASITNMSALVLTIVVPLIFLLCIIILVIKISGLQKMNVNHSIKMIGKRDEGMFVVTSPDYDGDFTVYHGIAGRTKIDRSISEDSGVDMIEGLAYEF